MTTTTTQEKFKLWIDFQIAKEQQDIAYKKYTQAMNGIDLSRLIRLAQDDIDTYMTIRDLPIEEIEVMYSVRKKLADEFYTVGNKEEADWYDMSASTIKSAIREYRWMENHV